MTIQSQLAALFRRDLTRLIQELEAFTDESDLWKTTEGVSNSAGNLTLHLEGNLREYVGRQLGSVAYERRRQDEFSRSGVSRAQLIERIGEVRELVAETISQLTDDTLSANFPEKVLAEDMPTQQFLLHLFGHLSYHLGQIDYLRRLLTRRGAIKLAAL